MPASLPTGKLLGPFTLDIKIFKRIDKDPDKLRQIFDFIAAPKPCMPPVLKDASQNAAEQTSRGRRPKSPRPPPRVWPHPNNKPVLSRPFPTLAGRRHVPKLFVGNQMPFLMIKKPQSTYLGRIIRDQIDARQKRIFRRDRLKDQILIERMEDEWDKIVESNCGISFMGEGSWAEESVKAMAGLLKVVRRNDDRTLIIAGKMQEIVEEEQALADMEKIQRRKEKKRMRLARKDAGCGKEKWTRRTGKMQDVASTLPCTEIVQPNESGRHGWTL
ncbi:hypothetical protein MMC22_002653 [Lobaria immixta]|nr:hypothetical protein [Lobaria immixta]